MSDSKRAAAADTSDRPSSVRLTSTARRSLAEGTRVTRPRRSARSTSPVTLDLSSPRNRASFVHRRPAVPQHAQQARLDDRQVVFGGPALEHALDHERKLSESVDGTELRPPGPTEAGP
jgi:hypothetical protein